MEVFTFDTEDCIALRKAVLKFYSKMSGADMVVPNVVDAKRPEKDVVSDFQMLMYTYILMEANREVERAAEIEMVVEHADGRKNTVPVVRKESKVVLEAYRKSYKKIKAYLPMNDMAFVSQYADVDEAVSERVEKIVQQTYYPILNNGMKHSENMPSEVSQVMAHAITGMCLAIMACEKGMCENHRVPSGVLKHLSDRICRFAASINQVNKTDTTYSTDDLAKAVGDCMKVMVNVMNSAMNDIYERASQIDLGKYVEVADYTLEEFEKMVKKVNGSGLRVKG